MVEALAEIGEMVEEGAVAISDADRPVTNPLLLRRVLEYARSFDVPVVAYSKDLDLADRGSMNESAVSTRIGLRGLPAAAEEVMVARDIVLARVGPRSTPSGPSLDSRQPRPGAFGQAKGLRGQLRCRPVPFHPHRRGRGFGQLRPELEDLSSVPFGSRRRGRDAGDLRRHGGCHRHGSLAAPRG